MHRSVFFDLFVCLFGAVTSALTAVLLFWIQSSSGVAVHAFSFWFVIPAGAMLAGALASSGHYVGARILRHRPGPLWFAVSLAMAVGTYLSVFYLQYTTPLSNGRVPSDLMTFGRYFQLVVTHTRINLFGLTTTGPIGMLGYVKGALQALGFAIAVNWVRVATRGIPYCAKCDGKLEPVSAAQRYTNSPSDLEKALAAAAALKSGQPVDDANQCLDTAGPAWDSAGLFRSVLELYRCGDCGSRIIHCISQQNSGSRWKELRDISLRKTLS